VRIDVASSVVNLTPHLISVFDAAGEVLAEYPPTGAVVRLESSFDPTGQVEGVPVGGLGYGRVVGLPPPTPGVLLVVSLPVKLCVPLRPDVATVAMEVRDATGRIIGCRGLANNVTMGE